MYQPKVCILEHNSYNISMCLFPPILLYLVFLSSVGKHDDAWRIQFPDHPPEVVGGVGQRALSSNVSISRQVSLEKNEIDHIMIGIQCLQAALLSFSINIPICIHFQHFSVFYKGFYIL